MGEHIVFGVIGQPGHVAAVGIHHIDIYAALRPVPLVAGTELLYLLPVAGKDYALAVWRPPGVPCIGGKLSQTRAVYIDNVDFGVPSCLPPNRMRRPSGDQSSTDPETVVRRLRPVPSTLTT